MPTRCRLVDRPFASQPRAQHHLFPIARVISLACYQAVQPGALLPCDALIDDEDPEIPAASRRRDSTDCITMFNEAGGTVHSSGHHPDIVGFLVGQSVDTEERFTLRISKRSYQFQLSYEKPCGPVHWMVWHYNQMHQIHVWRYVVGVLRRGAWYRDSALSKYLEVLGWHAWVDVLVRLCWLGRRAPKLRILSNCRSRLRQFDRTLSSGGVRAQPT
jgi:hypothetical protein